MNITLDDLAENTLVLARPHPIALVAHVPLHIARSWIEKAYLIPFEAPDGRKYILRKRIEDAVLSYLGLLDLDPKFHCLGFIDHTPILPAWADTDGYLHVYCCWCREFHHHGRGEGSRIPHCDWNNPWKERGSYILKPMGSWTTEIRKAAPTIRYPRI